MFCQKCGEQLPEGTNFCQKCGTKLVQENNPGQARTAPSAPNGITPAVRKKKPAVKLLIFIPLILILIGVAVFLFCLSKSKPGGRQSYSSDTYDDEDREDDHVGNQGESISLTRTYLNEVEGFSFMYPDDWEIEDTEEVLPEAIVSVARSGMFGIYARIAVMKDIDDGFYLTASRVDFEEMYSSVEDMSNVEIMDLSDIVLDGHSARKLTLACNNDIGTRMVEIQYFYIRDSYVYAVMCVVEDKNFDRYEPVFDAIMDTYSITV